MTRVALTQFDFTSPQYLANPVVEIGTAASDRADRPCPPADHRSCVADHHTGAGYPRP